MNECATNSKGTESAAADTLATFAKAGLTAFETWAKAVGDLARTGVALNPVLQNLAGSAAGKRCEIPPACWLPRSLGEIRSLVCPGGKAVLRIRVTNCQIRTSRIQVAMSESDFETQVTPDTLSLAAMERGWITASVSVPTDVCKGQQHEILVWIVGCNAHYLRWTVEGADGGSSSCHQVELDDCPDYVHHWYDHFYCNRPCFAPAANRIENPSKVPGRVASARGRAK